MKTGRRLLFLVMANDFERNRAGDLAGRFFDLSCAYRVEEWKMDYFSVELDEVVQRMKASCYLPRGFEQAYVNHAIDSSPAGPVKRVHAWGVEFDQAYLDWCADYVLKRCAKARAPGEAGSWDAQAVTWDLPGNFVLASKCYPFSARAPGGKVYVCDSFADYKEAIEILRGNEDEKEEKGREAD